MSVSSPLSRRLDGVSESATLKLNALVQSMKAQGIDVVNLTAGEPDFNVDDAVKKAVSDAMAANKSKYTPVAGIPELRTLIAEKTNRQQPSVARSQPWTASDVIVTNGGKQALFNAFLALLDIGDEVLIPAPFWLSYPEMVRLAGGAPRVLECAFESGFKLKPEQLREAVASGRAKILVLNSPSNPTGVMYSRAELAALGEVLLSAPGGDRVWVISDEIYDRIAFGEVEFCSFAEACPSLRDRTITVNGLSKSACMTGWRVGWSVAPSAVTQAMSTLQGQSTSGINSLAQWAGVAALKLPDEAFAWQVDTYRRRRDVAVSILKRAPGVQLIVPQGAFYVLIGMGRESMSFCEEMLREAKVAAVPGGPFGARDFFRISFALDEKALQEGCERIVRFLTARS